MSKRMMTRRRQKRRMTGTVMTKARREEAMRARWKRN
jgi:hypothetical protein